MAMPGFCGGLAKLQFISDDVGLNLTRHIGGGDEICRSRHKADKDAVGASFHRQTFLFRAANGRRYSPLAGFQRHGAPPVGAGNGGLQ